MKDPMRVSVVTSSRADYGLLERLLHGFKESSEFLLQLIATGTHLSPEFGYTVTEIEADGYKVNEKVEMLLSGDSSVAVAKSLGLATIGLAEAYARLAPDLVVLLGDRYEILAAAQAALVSRIPIAHIAGGDSTEGAYDEAIRHSITKMAHVHFVTNLDARQRVIQLGEDPARVHLVGSPGIDKLLASEIPDVRSLEEELGINFLGRTLLVTFHPPTLESGESQAQVMELLEALSTVGEDVSLVFTGTNADNEGRAVMASISEFVRSRPGQAHLFQSLGSRRYLGLLAMADAIVGNSSSGLYEAPTLSTPTVNIGTRQKGRMRASSVIDVPPDRAAIRRAIAHVLEGDYKVGESPYGSGSSVQKMLQVLAGITDPRALLKKSFYALDTKEHAL